MISMVDRSLFSPNLAEPASICDDEDFKYQDLDQEKRQKKYDSSQEHSPREPGNNINEIRQLIRDQSFLRADPNIIRNRNQYSESSEDYEVPVRHFTPLPGIPRYDDPYYRTESRLIKNELDGEGCFIDERPSSMNLNINETNLKRSLAQHESKYAYLFEADNYYNNNKKSINQMRFNKAEANKINHFASGHNKKCVHRLPALEKSINHSLPNAMDLDEDLPMNPVHEPTHRRDIYTSPGERLISPIKRPQAPSPAASGYRRRELINPSEAH